MLNNVALCLICKEMVSVFKGHNLKRNHMPKHAAQLDAFQEMFFKVKILKPEKVCHLNFFFFLTQKDS